MEGWAWFGIIEITWVIVLSIWILLERRPPRATLAWILALSVLPVLGMVIYLLIGPRKFTRRRLKVRRAQRAVHAAAPRHDEPQLHITQSHAAQLLIHMCEQAGGASPPRYAEIDLYLDGASGYAAMERAIESAAHHIHLEYYIWERDRTGRRFRDLLIERARAGIEVRLLVDGFGSNQTPDSFFRPLRDAGAEVARFNALTLARLRPRLINFRTHRKILVCDGATAFTGGLNISDVHTATYSGDAAWRDTMVRIMGSGARGLQRVFLEDWHYAVGSAPTGPRYLLDPATLRGRAEVLQIVSSGPDEHLNAIHKLYFSGISSAREQVLISSPYFVPDESIMCSLTTAALRGVNVQVLVPAGGDIPLVAAASRSYYPELLRAGVRIYEYGPPILHAKTAVIDNELAIVGTANLDTRSFALNFEVVAAMYGQSICAKLADAFTDDVRRAQEITLDDLLHAPWTRRLTESAARLLSPLL